MRRKSIGPHRPIIAKFGGINAAARALGHKNASTVQGWWERGWIPAPQQPKVLEAAQTTGVDIRPESFFTEHATQ